MTDPVVVAAALDYVGPGTSLIAESMREAFAAGAEWRDGHPKENPNG